MRVAAVSRIVGHVSPGRGGPRVLGLGLLVAALVVAAGLAATPQGASAQAAGPLLVDEDFRSVDVDARFQGYGTACLTALPAVTAYSDGLHPLLGCPAGEGNVPPTGADGFGYVQLTDAGVDRAGAVLFDEPIPSTGGVEITFDQWQYGWDTGLAPADGISFFLVDGSVSLSEPGAFGGSLGYAQKLPDGAGGDFLPGVDGGYLGIGLDVLGNFFGDWEQRGSGCDPRAPAGQSLLIPPPGANMVTVRGPGQGTEGYCFLTATSTNLPAGPWTSTLAPDTLQGPEPGVTLASLTPEQASAALEATKRTVTIVLTPSPNPHVTVSIDFGAGPVEVLDFDAPVPVPPTYKFGFAASTGSFDDVHLIRTTTVQAFVALPALSLVKRVASASDPVLAGSTIVYAFDVTNTGGVELGGIEIADPLVADATCPVAVLLPGESTTCTGSHVVTEADAEAGVVRNTAIARGSTAGTPVESAPSSVEVLVEDSLAASGIDTAAIVVAAVAGLVVVGLGILLLVRRRTKP